MIKDLINVILIFFVQLIYSTADLGQRYTALKFGYGWGLLAKPLFLLILIIPGIGLALQIFVLSRYEVSKTITLLGIFAVIITPIMGVMFLKEKMTIINWLGIFLAMAAIFLVTSKR